MDKRGRDAYRRNRTEVRGVNFVACPITLDVAVAEFIDKEVLKTETKNVSEYIENIIKDAKIEEMPKRRKFKTFPAKKTLTLSKAIHDKIKKSGNISLFIDKVFIEKFGLKANES